MLQTNRKEREINRDLLADNLFELKFITNFFSSMYPPSNLNFKLKKTNLTLICV